MDFSNVHVGDHVVITLLTNFAKQSEGKIFKILSAKPDETVVVLKNGDKGKVVQIINSEDVIKKRIMSEGQYTENKENFGAEFMHDKSIPQAVQSFLNSDGGFLYIGVKDTGELKERIVGLDYDFEIIDKKNEYTNDKRCDKLEINIMTSLDKYLESDQPIGPLVEIRFPVICGIPIIELKIKKSPKPWFYKHISKKGKLQEFELRLNNELIRTRILDDFYIRRGGSKHMLSTHSEFYKYSKDRFENYK